MAHPAPSAAREPAAIRLHLPLPEGAGRREGQGAGDHRADHQPAVGGRAAPAQLGAARLGQLFRHGASAKTFAYLDAFSWRRVMRWLCRKHPRTGWRVLCRRWLPGWRPTEGSITLFHPGTVAIRRYRYRGTQIPTPWQAA